MLDRPSKRGREGFVDLTGDEDAPQAQDSRAARGFDASSLRAASNSLISDDEDDYQILYGGPAQLEAGIDERPGPSRRAAEGEALPGPSVALPLEQVHVAVRQPRRELPGDMKDDVSEPGPSLQQVNG